MWVIWRMSTSLTWNVPLFTVVVYKDENEQSESPALKGSTGWTEIDTLQNACRWTAAISPHRVRPAKAYLPHRIQGIRVHAINTVACTHQIWLGEHELTESAGVNLWQKYMTEWDFYALNRTPSVNFVDKSACNVLCWSGIGRVDKLPNSISST